MSTIMHNTTWYEEAHHGNAHNPALYYLVWRSPSWQCPQSCPKLPGMKMKKPIMAMSTIMHNTTWYEEAHHGNAHNPALYYLVWRSPSWQCPQSCPKLPGMKMKKPIMAMPTILPETTYLVWRSPSWQCPQSWYQGLFWVLHLSLPNAIKDHRKPISNLQLTFTHRKITEILKIIFFQ